MIVGKSGSGKSTLLKLLMKYYEVDNNKIFINNIDINNYTEKALNNNIGVVATKEGHHGAVISCHPSVTNKQIEEEAIKLNGVEYLTKENLKFV